MQKKSYPELIKSDIKLTIGMLVSNHVEYIRKVMEALKPLLLAVPSELVVIDTKGEETDGSIAIVREYTDKIYPFTWCNDFSAARNFCLSHAKGEWFLYQDDDEWFDDVQEFIDFFQSGECERYYSGYYYTKDYAADGSSSMAIAGRMIRRTTDTKFVGKVHETFNEVYAPNKLFQCFTHHMGYVYTTEEAQKKHQERNLMILREEFKERGYTPVVCSQIVQELLAVKETAKEGFTFAMESLEEFRRQDKLLNSNVQWILVASVRYFSLTGEYEAQLAHVAQLQKEYPFTQMAALALAAVVAVESARNEDAERMCQFAKQFMENWDWLKSHEEEALLQTQLDFPRYYTEGYYNNIAGLAAVAANRMGDYLLANSYWKRLPWQQPGFDGAKYAEELQKTVNGLTLLVSKEKKEYNKQEEPKAKTPVFVQSDIKLTIGMLVSNRKQYIRKVLDGIKPLLDAVPSELIVVDTKGADGDGSIDIVREYTDNIYSFAWCDDFSAARNVCLEHAKGEWFMYLDDDECFDNVQELIEFFQSGKYKQYGSGYYYIKNYAKDGASSMTIVGRMVRRTATTRFVGRVHEGFNEVYEPKKVFQCFAHHYGYVFADDVAKKEHQRRNVSLLQKELETAGPTPRICAQMMQELLYRKETAEEGYQFYLANIKELEKNNQLADSCTQWMLVASVRYFKIKNDYDGLLTQTRCLMEQYPLNQMAQAALAGVVIEASAPKGNLTAILDYAPLYKEAWLWLQKNETEAIPQKQLDFPKYITQEYAIQVFQAAATCANAVQDYVTAYGYWEMLPWNDKSFDGSPYVKGMQETLAGLEQAGE